ncbi:MAG TPA: excalibur calcium-binding domain-containing protein [Jatrophihabitans sp.]|nr:excalibur calcium-binding domain-containing protein [Jatrophihabitans sp.]
MRRIISTLAVATAAVLPVVLAVPASAQAGDVVVKAGTAAGAIYYGPTAARDAAKFATGLEVVRNPAGELVDVRATSTVAGWYRASRVQVDSVRLATATTVVLARTSPVASASLATATTGWRAIAPGTCTRYRSITGYSVRWANGVTGRYTKASPLITVCGPSRPAVFANCASLNRVFPHGIGRAGAHDVVRGSTAPVTDFYVSSYLYAANSGRDADHDGVACERH